MNFIQQKSVAMHHCCIMDQFAKQENFLESDHHCAPFGVLIGEQAEIDLKM